MYGMVLMAALTTADVTPDFGHRCGCHGGGWGCCGCYGGCYGGCWGGCYGGCWGGCWGGCYGGYGGCYGCWGGYSLWSAGCVGCYGGCMGCYGGCFGCYGGGYGGGIGVGYDMGAGIGAGVGVGGAGVMGGGPYLGTGTDGTGTDKGTDKGTGDDTEKVGPPRDKNKKKTGTDGTMLPTKAQLVVELPADAKLYIDDQPMKTPSGKRTFNTPRLQPEQTYYYILRAEVQRDGKTVSKSRRVLIRAGEVVRASFPELAADESVAQAGR